MRPTADGDTEVKATPSPEELAEAATEAATPMGTETIAQATTHAAPSGASPASTDAGAAWAPGELIDRFTVLEFLGRGGMGVVVSAHDPRLDRRVAIKLVSQAHGTGRTEARASLLKEARAMAKLRHPNVVSVHEAGEHRGHVFVAMEQVLGTTLRRTLARGNDSARADWRAIVELFI